MINVAIVNPETNATIEVTSHRNEVLNGSFINLVFFDAAHEELGRHRHSFENEDAAEKPEGKEFLKRQLRLDPPANAADVSYDYYVATLDHPLVSGQYHIMPNDDVSNASPLWQIMNALTGESDWTALRKTHGNANTKHDHLDLVVGGLFASSGMALVHAPGPFKVEGVDLIALSETDRVCYLVSCHEGHDWNKKLQTLVPMHKKVVKTLPCMEGWKVQSIVASDSDQGLLSGDRVNAGHEGIALLTTLEGLKEIASKGPLESRKQELADWVSSCIPS